MGQPFTSKNHSIDIRLLKRVREYRKDTHLVVSVAAGDGEETYFAVSMGSDCRLFWRDLVYVNAPREFDGLKQCRL